MSVPQSHVTSFSTDMLPEQKRFDAFLEDVARKLMRTDVMHRPEGPFYSHSRASQLGDKTCSEFVVSPASYGRSQDLLADGNDNFILMVNAGPPIHDTLRDRMVGTGEGALVCCSTSAYFTTTTSSKMLLVSVPFKQLVRLAPAAEDIANTAIVKECAELQLLGTYVTTILNSPVSSLPFLQVAGSHMLDLVALALGASGQAAEEASAGGLRAARSLAVRQSILTRLSEPGLTLVDIAKMNAISERYVQRLFEDLGTSFSNYLIEQRLTLAHRLLCNPLYRNRLISDIAIEAGFGDLSHFNRSFRQRFADTPSGVRARAIV